MKIDTRKFGEIEIDEEKIIDMPLGLAGFPGKRRFVLLQSEETKPFYWFQSIEAPNLALIVMSPFLFMPDYSVNLNPAINEMSWKDDKDYIKEIYVVVSIGEGGPQHITANLIGPLVVNRKRHEAVQLVIYDSPYSHQYPIMNKN